MRPRVRHDPPRLGSPAEECGNSTGASLSPRATADLPAEAALPIQFVNRAKLRPTSRRHPRDRPHRLGAVAEFRVAVGGELEVGERLERAAQPVGV